MTNKEKMTPEEAIEILRQFKKCLSDVVFDEKGSEAWQMAIQALSQEPCDDMVSRDAALEKMADYVASGYADSAEDFLGYSRIICQLPSVTQKSIVCDDAVSRILARMWNCRGKHTTSIDKVKMEQIIRDELPSVTQKPIECEDAISRQAVLDVINTAWTIDDLDNLTNAMLTDMIKTLQPVNPQQKSGKWIWDNKSNVYRCSCCNQFPWRIDTEENDEVFINMERTNAYKYCPDCGAKMVEPQESEVNNG